MPQLPPWSPGNWTPGDWTPGGPQPPSGGGGQLPPVNWTPPQWQNPFNAGPPGNDSPSSASAGTVADYRGRTSAPPNSVGNGLPSLSGMLDYFKNNPGATGAGVGLLANLFGAGPLVSFGARRLAEGYMGNQPFPGPQEAGWYEGQFAWLPGYMQEQGQAQPGMSPYSNQTMENLQNLSNYTYMPESDMLRFTTGLGTYHTPSGAATALRPEDATFIGNPFYQPGEMIDNRPQGERRE